MNLSPSRGRKEGISSCFEKARFNSLPVSNSLCGAGRTPIVCALLVCKTRAMTSFLDLKGKWVYTTVQETGGRSMQNKCIQPNSVNTIASLFYEIIYFLNNDILEVFGEEGNTSKYQNVYFQLKLFPQFFVNLLVPFDKFETYHKFRARNLIVNQQSLPSTHVTSEMPSSKHKNTSPVWRAHTYILFGNKLLIAKTVKVKESKLSSILNSVRFAPKITKF